MSQDLDNIDRQLDNMLDGMRVNRERLAGDVKAVLGELRRFRKAHAERQASDSKPSFTDAFKGLF